MNPIHDADAPPGRESRASAAGATATPNDPPRHLRGRRQVAHRNTDRSGDNHLAAATSSRASGEQGHTVAKGLSMDNEQIARVAREVNRAYCQALVDDSQPAWEDAPQWQRESALLGVKLHIENPLAGPQASHESWMAQKVADGWVYGPEKRPDLKQHHCIVPFDQLPREQQAKDFIFRAVVHALATA